ncbi:MAG: putative Fe-S cluster assembly protein SufT [Burkholderiales bacterium]|nr:putative Fe-S cluster assembly protein SufT [Burkholderiales bacterium]MDE2395995.1 putative Fe-S cluster assembly protein SufT [Burkholderiales bacterium]MDE2454064.1 putative Fe-S cluster assembly protein SufT [Burkholderiales bacterium]
MSPRWQSLLTTRPVLVERIPDGTPVDLAEGVEVQFAQAMGTAFTLVVRGQMLRLKGSDADAIGLEPPQGVVIPEHAGPDDVRDLVWEVLRSCYDPEIPVNIVELGLVYGCDIEPLGDGKVRVSIRMTLTAPGCGMGEVLADDICSKLLALPHVGDAAVEMVFDPPWDRSRMSEAALLTLGL